MLIRSGDIRNQTRKWSQIAKNFGRFFGRHKFLRTGIVKIVPKLSPLPRRTSTKKSREDTPTSPEVIESNTLNFGPDFLFSLLIFFVPCPSWDVPYWSISSAYKNFMA